MRILKIFVLGLSAAGLTFAQSTTALQTLHLSVQAPIRISAASARLAVEVRQEGRSLVGRIGDRIFLRSRPGRKISACLKDALPPTAELTLRFGNEATGASELVALNGADRTVDQTKDQRSGPTTELDVEYRWTSDAGSTPQASETRTIVYTLTD